jgi:biopolymer transport protein ExbB/TolQ
MFPAGALQAVTPESINQAVDLFEIIKQLRLRLTSINEETLDRSFETHIQNVLEKLEKRLPFLSDNEAKNVEIVMAKHGLCDASFQQIILLCQQISPSLGDVLKQLRNIHSEFFSELQSISNQYLDRFNEQQKISNEMNQKIQNLEQECDELLAATKILDQVPIFSLLLLIVIDRKPRRTIS